MSSNQVCIGMPESAKAGNYKLTTEFSAKFDGKTWTIEQPYLGEVKEVKRESVWQVRQMVESHTPWWTIPAEILLAAFIVVWIQFTSYRKRLK